MPNIKIQSSDGVVFDLDEQIARYSPTIRIMLEDHKMEEGKVEVVPLSHVNSMILEKDDPPSVEEEMSKEDRTDEISTWDSDFLKLAPGTLFELIMAANYLKVYGLLDVTCKTVAGMIMEKSPEEIRKTFKIKNDFTAAEEEQARKEKKWCEEK